MNYSKSLECYTGCAYPQETDTEVTMLTSKFAKLMIDQTDMARVEEMGWAPVH